ncbi:MAG: antitoxin [Methylococcaceae bacterium]|nr:antitoxin [Methylococcaceae bacterium]
MNIDLLNEAIKIPPNERVALAELILESIDYEDESIKKTWVSEVKNRMESVKEGKSKLLDFNQLYVED